MMERDALQVMKFMASNGLIANPKKTALLILNHKFIIGEEITVKIGNEDIKQVPCAKLLGITFEGNQKWHEHIFGTGGVIASLSQRLFFIRRLKNNISQSALLKISDGIFMSKIRYGLQLLGKVRWNDSDPPCSDIDAIQKCQNKLLRILNGTRISDQVSTKSMLVKFKMLSVNQLMAQIKLFEMWKSIHVNNYPIHTEILSPKEDGLSTRARSNGLLIKEGKATNLSQRTFLNDAIHIWNQSPNEIKECVSLFSVKKSYKIFCGNVAYLMVVYTITCLPSFI